MNTDCHLLALQTVLPSHKLVGVKKQLQCTANGFSMIQLLRCRIQKTTEIVMGYLETVSHRNSSWDD